MALGSLSSRRAYNAAVVGGDRIIRTGAMLEGVLGDVRYGLVQLRTSPAFALAVIFTIALGIGAVSAVFTLADPILFRPLPYPDADRIVSVRARGGGPGSFVQVADFLEAEASHSGFASVASIATDAVGRVEGSDAVVLSYGITSGFFDVFSVRL